MPAAASRALAGAVMGMASRGVVASRMARIVRGPAPVMAIMAPRRQKLVAGRGAGHRVKAVVMMAVGHREAALMLPVPIVRRCAVLVVVLAKGLMPARIAVTSTALRPGRALGIVPPRTAPIIPIMPVRRRRNRGRPIGLPVAVLAAALPRIAARSRPVLPSVGHGLRRRAAWPEKDRGDEGATTFERPSGRVAQEHCVLASCRREQTVLFCVCCVCTPQNGEVFSDQLCFRACHGFVRPYAAAKTAG